MAEKIRVKANQSGLIVKIHLSADEEISQRDLEVMSREKLRGVLYPQKKRRNQIVCTGPVGTNLLALLERPISKYQFLYLMAQTINVTQKLQKSELFLNNLILDLRYVYMSEKTREVQFLYLPVVRNYVSIDVLAFMAAVAYRAIPAREEDMGYLPRFISFIKEQKKFDADTFEQFLRKENPSIIARVKENNQGERWFLVEASGGLEKIQAKPKETIPLNQMNQNKKSMRRGMMQESTLLEDDQPCGRSDAVALTRVKTGEVVSITKPVFRVGKEQCYVDYCVYNNNAVSRSHMDIITRGNHHFAVDLNSKNGSFVNGVRITPKVETEIVDGDCIILADEEFVFQG
ncbi:MAG: FHA domain-containing protein [Roseburia sp.]|nr:FHA domain-containing protein [Roseburia sp.]